MISDDNNSSDVKRENPRRGFTGGYSHNPNFDDSGEGFDNKERGNFRGGQPGRFAKSGVNEADRPRGGAMEVLVDHSLEKAMKILKRKLIKEGLFKELKSRRYYEKPSERKKRKLKESMKKIRKEEARARKNALLY